MATLFFHVFPTPTYIMAAANLYSASPELMDLDIVINAPFNTYQRIVGGFDTGYLADDEEFIPIYKPRRTFNYHRRNLLDIAARESDRGFRQLFRVTRPVFEAICEEVAPHLPPGKIA